VRIETDNKPQRIVVDLLESNRRAFIIAETIEVEKANVETNQTIRINLDKVFPGDLVVLSVEVGGGNPWPPGTLATGILVRAREIQGRLATVRGSEIALLDGRKFRLVEDARFFLRGQWVSADKLQHGMGVVLRQNPLTGYVTGVEATIASL
jgi:hypothetical protein